MDSKTIIRFESKIVKTYTCWVWIGSISCGYGNFRANGGQIQAHRFAYELYVGPIPDGFVIDHLCKHKWCVNPDHLEPVRQQENIRRHHRSRRASRPLF